MPTSTRYLFENNMAAREDVYVNKMPWGITLRLNRELDPGDKWEELLGSIQVNPLDGPPLDPDFRGILSNCHQRRQSPTERLLSELGHKGYRVKDLKYWLGRAGLQRALDILESVCVRACVRVWYVWMYVRYVHNRVRQKF